MPVERGEISGDRKLKGVVRKTAGNFPNAEERIITETVALLFIEREIPELVPRVLSYNLGKEIVTQEVDTRVSKPTSQILALIEELQTLPDPKALPIMKAVDYHLDAARKIQELFRDGAINERTAGNLSVYYEDHVESLDAFGTTFCHGDMQRRNIGKHNNRMVTFDFEQAHMGSELEDYVFFAVSSRFLPDRGNRGKVYRHLVAKFGQDEYRQAQFQEAVDLLFVDRYLHVLHWDTFNKEPSNMNRVIRFYAKNMINNALEGERRRSRSGHQMPSFESDPIND